MNNSKSSDEKLADELSGEIKPTGEMPGVDVPEDVQEEARSIVRGAFRLFSDHNQRLADNLAEFNQKRRETAETLDRGARRTSGRIV